MGEPIAGVSGSGAVLTVVLPAPRRRSWETDATPSARNSGSIACQRFCIGCLGTVGRSLLTKTRGGWLAPGPRPTSTAHLRRRAGISPHRVSHPSAGGAGWLNPAGGDQAAGSAWAVLGAGLTHPPPLSFLCSSYRRPRRRDDIRTTSEPHDSHSGRGLTNSRPPFPTHAPSRRVTH